MSRLIWSKPKTRVSANRPLAWLRSIVAITPNGAGAESVDRMRGEMGYAASQDEGKTKPEVGAKSAAVPPSFPTDGIENSL